MTTMLLVYIAGSIVFGGLATTSEVRRRSAEIALESLGAKKAPRTSKIGLLWIGLVAVGWPLLLLAVAVT